VHWIRNRYAFGTEDSDLKSATVLQTTSFVAANSYATITSRILSGRVHEQHVMSSGDHIFG
jgi:hypothetical protein